MSSTAPYWLNIDVPTKRCVLHRSGCRHAQAKQETPYKGIEQLKRDGCWLSFPSPDEAEAYVRREWQAKGYPPMIHCADCTS